MIQYPITRRNLHKAIKDGLPAKRNKSGGLRKHGRLAWLTRAAQETRRIRTEGAYKEENHEEIWRELKNILSELQGKGKCAYCETKLARYRSGAVDGDVEHYRPKNGVRHWPNTFGIPTGKPDNRCYYRLAFNPRNYLVSCRICNQDFKRNYFPIAKSRCSADSISKSALKAEDPYLLHPLDPSEPDPEDCIEFLGVNPKPRVPAGTPEYKRAMVTIDLLGLGGGKRLDLDIERAEVITRLYLALELNGKCPGHPEAEAVIAELGNNSVEHRNCARSFYRLYLHDPVSAKKEAKEAQSVIDDSKSR